MAIEIAHAARSPSRTHAVTAAMATTPTHMAVVPAKCGVGSSAGKPPTSVPLGGLKLGATAHGRGLLDAARHQPAHAEEALARA
jgi:hypothetical protein